MNNKSSFVVVIGYSSVDYSMRVRDFRGIGNTTLVQRRLSATWPEAGGVARFFPGLVDGSKCAAISWVGSDKQSQEWTQEIESIGVDTSGISVLAGTAPTSYLFHDTLGSTTCFFAPGILDSSHQIISESQSQLLLNASHVIAAVGPEAATRQMLEILKPSTVLIWTVKADSESLPLDLRTRLFQRANIVIYSHQELPFLQEISLIGDKDPLQANFAKKLIIRTSGKSQVECTDDGVRASFEVDPIEGEINATGAGDYFAGQFIGSYIPTTKLSASVELAISRTSIFLSNRTYEKVSTQ
jgi:hypothetical protein